MGESVFKNIHTGAPTKCTKFHWILLNGHQVSDFLVIAIITSHTNDVTTQNIVVQIKFK